MDHHDGLMGQIVDLVDRIKGMEPFKGTERTLAEYKQLAGIYEDFRALHQERWGYSPQWTPTILEDPAYVGLLALRIVEHDLTSPFSAVSAVARQDVPYDSSWDICFERILLGIKTIGYVATGHDSYKTPLTPDQCSRLWRSSGLLGSGIQTDGGSVDSTHEFAVYQLAKNALDKFMLARKNGRIDPATRLEMQVAYRAEDTLAVSVQDNGGGIPPEVIPRIFSGYTEGGNGTGLQLVSQIAKHQGGWIEVLTRQPGRDAYTFTTRDGVVAPIEWANPHGTRFTLQVPGDRSPARGDLEAKAV